MVFCGGLRSLAASFFAPGYRYSVDTGSAIDSLFLNREGFQLNCDNYKRVSRFKF